MERTFETPKPVRLVVENESGLVTVAAVAAATTSVSVRAETPGAEELVEHTTIECRPSGDTHIVVVKVPRPRGPRLLRRQAVLVHVEVPESSDVAVATAAADIEVTGAVGAADVKTASGDVSTDDIGGGLRATTASGNVIVGTVTGELRMRSASGDLRCTRVTGRADCASTSGDVEIGAADDTVEVRATSGNVRLGELHHGAKVANVSGNVRVLSLGEGRLFVRSVSGDVAVGVPSGVDLFVDVSTLGAFRSDITIEDTSAPERSRIKVDLSVSSVSGNVEIERALEHVA
jgi:Putative adhesin